MNRMDDLIDRQQAIDAIASVPGVGNRAIDKLKELPPAQPEQQWIPIFDGEGQLPEVDSEGESDYILISCDNYTIPLIGQYRVDKEGGAFYDGDNDEPLVRYGLIVNAWMPLPKHYTEE